MVKKMRDEGKFDNDEDIDVPPKIFIGAASNPFADPIDYRIYRLANKIDAGADFIQTQCIYNMPRFREFMKKAVDMGLAEKCYILAGVTPMKSAGMAKYMAKFVPGMDVPPELIERIERCRQGQTWPPRASSSPVEQIEEFKEMEGVAGVHFMAIEWEHKVPEIAEQAGVLPRPKMD
jgi:methylenetetrahydrofolate reductase (NADPH)